jgi:hypothetical protein
VIGGDNEHIPPRQPDGASRLLVKGAVRMKKDANSAKRGVNEESMDGRWCGGGCVGNLTQKTRRGTTHHTTRSAHAQAVQFENCGFGEALPKSCKCSRSQYQTASFGRAQHWK